MFCKNCGSKLNEGVQFCERCGQKTEASQSHTAQQEPVGKENFATANKNYHIKVAEKIYGFMPKKKLSEKTKKILIIAGVVLLALIVAFPLTAFIKNQISIIAYDVARELVRDNMAAMKDMAYEAANEAIAENVPIIAKDIASRIVEDNMEKVPEIVREEAGELISIYDIEQAQREKDITLVVEDIELSTNSFFGYENSYWWEFTVPPSLPNVTIECRSSYGIETAFLTRTEDDANKFYRGGSCDTVQGTVKSDKKVYYYEIGLPPGTYYFCVRGKTAWHKIAGNQVQVKIVAKAEH